MQERTRFNRAVLSLGLSFWMVADCLAPTFAQGDPTEHHSSFIKKQLQNVQPPNPVERGLVRSSFAYTPLAPLSYEDIKVPGFSAASIDLLAFKHFVVIDNTKFMDMADLYRENRLTGKSNFVTADSILHPYFAFSNRILADAITHHIVPELGQLLRAMLAVALDDYKNADDKDVRLDIERNIAFLSVGLKLLDNDFKVPSVGNVAPAVSQDLGSIRRGDNTQSSVLDDNVNFAVFQPIGWYMSDPVLQDFYRCKEWISRIGCPITGTKFRRSYLLYRDLDLARIGTEPAYNLWLKLSQAWTLLGLPLSNWQANSISAAEYRTLITAASSDLKVTLSALADPMFYTRLLVAMHKQKAVGLPSTSILEMESAHAINTPAAAFRLFPVSGDPELPWLRAAVKAFQDPKALGATPWPLALAVLHTWGSLQANTILLVNALTHDPQLFDSLQILDTLTRKKAGPGEAKPVFNRIWWILSAYFDIPPQTAQAVFLSEDWTVRHLESAFAGWVDAHLAIAPAKSAQTAAEAAPADQPARIAFHYLEPTPAVFDRIARDAQTLQENLQSLAYLEKADSDRFADFIRLSKRLKAIAVAEVARKGVIPADMKLLGNIDLVLAKVTVPLPGVLLIPGSENKSGVNLALGRPGALYIYRKEGSMEKLMRGAVYTYFEISGAAIPFDLWHRKLAVEPQKPPEWTSKFDLVHE